MKAMVLTRVGTPLHLEEVPMPPLTAESVLIQVEACGVCRTDLHIIDGELKNPHLPLILGHQVVGTLTAVGAQVIGFKAGDRVGVPWLGKTCGACFYCRSAHENLCDQAQFNGYDFNGGYADYCTADYRYCFPLTTKEEATSLAPLLCAGLIGYRALRLAGNPHRIGFYGFGASAHILTQVVTQRGGEVYAFSRPGDFKTQAFAKSLGAVWSGGSDQHPPVSLDAAIIFAPLGALFPLALTAVRKGGIVVSAGIHMSDIPAFKYELLWGERVIRSVANLTREDGKEFLTLAQTVPIKVHTTIYPLAEANQALADLKEGHLQGAAVLQLPA